MGRGKNATVNVRMPDDLLDQIDTAATKAHLERSGWCRELITAAVRSGRDLEELCDAITTSDDTPAPVAVPPISERVRTKLGQRKALTGRCLHPVHAVRRYPTQDVCGACNTVVRTR